VKGERMKVKIEELVNSRQPLERILGEKLPPKVGYTLTRNARMIEQELIAYDKQRENLIKEFGQGDEKDGWRIEPGDVEAVKKFNEGLQELLEMEVDVDVRIIDENQFIEQMEKYELMITGRDWIRIGYMIKDGKK